MPYQIRWKKQDYLRLGKAVASFNKKLNEIRTDFNEDYLPQEKSYQEIKETIKTRNDLKRAINSLNRFKQEGAEEIYQTEAGEIMTKWERRELGIQSRSAQVRLKAELKKLEQKPSRYMGSNRADEIKASIRKLKSIEKRTNKKFRDLKEYIYNKASSSFELTKLEVYRDNYLKNLKNLAETNKGYAKTYDKLSKIENPKKFYDTIQNSQLATDFFEWYRQPASYGGFETSDEVAEYLFNDLFGD